MSVWGSALFAVLQTALIVYVVIGLGGFLLANVIMYHPPSPATYNDEQGIVKINVTPSIQISAKYVTAKDAKYTILISHGNAEDIGYMQGIMEGFVNKGFNVLAYDYQGYGTSDGKPSEHNTYQDINAAYRYLVEEQKTPPENIILFGRSIGSGPTVQLASKKTPIGGVILEAPFVSAFRVVTSFKIYPVDKYENIKKIRKVRAPVMIIHGKDDDIIPFWHGSMLYDEIKNRKEFFWVENAGHNDLPHVAGNSYFDKIAKFIKSLDKQSKK